ncbi:extracellular catalytic domain type 1 short-chain-length polyhydroxyalkanoate depolymerase [Hyphomicrobium facile]|uniref:Esterase, PHB depolymerase family n=1 Tax=Hyphomicrobium facile TaxID=51670 RepID=A0A1I7NR64_9HYPH|nr:PHB depolymerase family esterase [Hyphomicrobium facile]SFV37090.1 esterase, PHB depolymerase family [Hyphomicrobium facile]
MKTFDLGKIHEATRLTRAGRLNEALALLQAAAISPTTAVASAPRTIDGEIVSDQVRPAKLSAVLPELLRSFDGANLPGARRYALRAADIAPEGGRYISGSFSNSEGRRSYKLYIPTIRDAGPRPLIVMLHGCTQSADDFAAGTRMNFVAEEHGCFVVYPEQPQAANASKCWNWFRPGDQARGKGEPSLIAGITRQVVEEHDIDQARIYVAGLSAGGAAAAIMGEAYPELYAAVGVHSGLACGSAEDVASAFNAMRGLGKDVGSGASGAIKPTIVFHGDRDATVHPSNGAKVIARVAGNTNFQVRTERKTTSQGYSVSHSVHRDAFGLNILELWELHGGGHSWSGGSSAGSFTSDGPDASKEMLRFFLEHRRAL